MKVPFIAIVLAASIQAAYGNSQNDHYLSTLARENETFISCDEFYQERVLCERLQSARELVRGITLQTFMRQEGKKAIRYREFALIAFDPVEENFRIIMLGMPVDVSKQPDFQPIVLSEDDALLRVRRVRGSSLNKMVFEITSDGRPLYAYAGKHLLFTEERHRNGQKSEIIEPVVYLATPPYLVNDEFARKGQELFMAAIEQAISELRASGVPSLAYPGRLVSEIVTVNEIAKLVVAEQTDPCFLGKRPAACERLIPVRPYPDDWVAMQGVNAEFVVNGLAAFSRMRSAAAARGVLQFTNNRNRYSAGTYSVIAERYPAAELDPNFPRGAMSFKNLAKAAACLIDLELASSKIPPWFREAFLADRDFGMVVPGSAYNGGGSQSQLLSQLFAGFVKRHGIQSLTFDRFPWDQFLEWVDRSVVKLKPETRGYIQKLIIIRDHLLRHRPSPPVNFEGVLA